MADELLDTNILIDFLRNRPEAVEYFSALSLIAATAELDKKNLVTRNKKHFPMLSKVIVPY